MTMQSEHAFSWLFATFLILSMQPNFIFSTLNSNLARTSNWTVQSTSRQDITHLHLRNKSEIGQWNVSESDLTSTCILLKGLITLGINYTDIVNNTKIGYMDVPATATASGNCDKHFITLSWANGNFSQSQSLKNTLTIVFQANERRKKKLAALSNPIPVGKFAISKIAAVLYKNEEIFPNVTSPEEPFIINLEGLAMLPTTLSHSFACYATLTFGEPNKQLTILLQNLQIEAYRRVPKGQSGDNSFNAAEHCAADEISSGSVVGTVIIAILSIVLIALAVAAVATYVLKKRRSASVSGYQTM